jgi:Predicted nucleic acid-binding protein, contains PIN domain
MTTAIDTNVLVALWDRSSALNKIAQSALDSSMKSGALVVAGPVYSELMAAPGRDERFLDLFLRDTGVAVDWDLDQATWRSAGRAYQVYAADRRQQRDAGPRRILADFLIGAHALRKGFRLLTLDDRIYRKAFPGLSIVRI